LHRIPSVVFGVNGQVKKSALTQMKVAELQSLCNSLGLKDQGKKAELVGRIMEQLSSAASGGVSLGEQGASEGAERAAGNGGAPLRASGAAGTAAPPEEPPAEGAEADRRQTEVSSTGVTTGGACDITVTWLGTSSGAPTLRRNVSSVAVDLGDPGVLLVDCGEGTRRQLSRAGISLRRIRCICITHMHGDHCFGVPALLQTLSYIWAGEPESDRRPVHIYGPPGIFEWVEASVQMTGIKLSMRVLVVELHKSKAHAMEPAAVDAGRMLWLAKASPSQQSIALANRLSHEEGNGEDPAAERLRKAGVVNGLAWSIPVGGRFRILASQLLHRVPCVGYCIQEQRIRVPISDAVAKDHPVLGDAQDYEASIPGRKILILGDTSDSRSISHFAADADLVSHEATFSDGMEQKAATACHSTARMAGEFARSIGARRLFLTHFSPRYQTNSGNTAQRLPPLATDFPAEVLDDNQDDVAPSDIDMIVAQAREGFGNGRVTAVDDLFTYAVPQREPQVRRASSSS